MKLRHITILCLFAIALLMGHSATAQTNVTGQIFLPDGNTPSHPIRFSIDSLAGGTLHDIQYTDSKGKFILEHLDPDASYTITVEGDDENYATTKYEFIPDESSDPRFYLNPIPEKKFVKPAPYKPNSKVADLHDRGLKAFEQNDPAEAERLLREVVNDDPKYVVGFNDLGVVLMRERKYADAEQVFRKGLQVDPNSVAVLQNLGTDLVHAGKYQDAIEPLKGALHLQPNRSEAHLQLGAALVETGQYAEAEQELLAAQRGKGVDEAGLQLYFGKLYASTGNYAKAIAAFNAFLSLAPADSPSLPAIRAAIERMQQAMAKSGGH
jgi:tetratricopeptide (TPR) repeat protein